MKKLFLTALASEQNFASKAVQYYLVFNNGELRVPVTEAAAEIVVKEMYGEQPEEQEQEVAQESNGHSYTEEPPRNDDNQDEDGVDQV